MQGRNQLLWLHCNTLLKKAQVGTPMNNHLSENLGLWRCSSEAATAAITQGLATHRDFMVITGISVLARHGEELLESNFEAVTPRKIQAAWDVLQRQRLLEDGSLADNLALGDLAWRRAGEEEEEEEEEADSVVFGSDVEVEVLSDDALRSWVATFLLGNPHL